MKLGKSSALWRSAVDAKSGRTYYINKETKEVTWNKPVELATPTEAAEIYKKKQEQKDFFRAMEQNIKNKINKNEYSLAATPDKFYDFDFDLDNSMQSVKERLNSNSTGNSTTRMVRTISSLDDELLAMVRKNDAKAHIGNFSRNRTGSDDLGGARVKKDMPRSPSKNDMRISSFSPSYDNGFGYYLSESRDTYDSPLTPRSRFDNPPTPSPRAQMKRRNSTGTIYIGTTMTAQDNEATIKCVCSVIRHHMVEAAKLGYEPKPEFDIFRDTPEMIRENSIACSPSARNSTPSLNTIVDFFKLIYSKSQLECECIIISLIYIERLVKKTQGRFVLKINNWRSCVFACLMMASKVWDDLSMWNIDFSHVSSSFDLNRVNDLELCLLSTLKYYIKVSASEYAKYYFHLRSMMIKLRYHANELQRLQPLNVTDAKKLQLTSERMQNESEQTTLRRKWRSVQESLDRISLSSDKIGDTNKHVVVLEELITNNHLDADGSLHGVSAERNRSILRRSFAQSEPISIAQGKGYVVGGYDHSGAKDYGYGRDDKSHKK